VADDVAGHRRTDDGQPAHRRGPGLGVVASRPVLPDELADAAGPQDADQQRRSDQRQDEGGRRRQQQGDHAAPPSQGRRASATPASRPTPTTPATATAGAAWPAWWAPRTGGGGTSVAPQGVSRWKAGRRSSSSCTALTRTSAAAAAPAVRTAAPLRPRSRGVM